MNRHILKPVSSSQVSCDFFPVYLFSESCFRGRDGDAMLGEKCEPTSHNFSGNITIYPVNV